MRKVYVVFSAREIVLDGFLKYYQLELKQSVLSLDLRLAYDLLVALKTWSVVPSDICALISFASPLCIMCFVHNMYVRIHKQVVQQDM